MWAQNQTLGPKILHRQEEAEEDKFLDKFSNPQIRFEL